MSKIYEVRARRDDRIHSFGARQTRADAQELLDESERRVAFAGGKNDAYWIEEIDTTGLFEIPSRPTPRDRFTVRITEPRKTPGVRRPVEVDVLDGDIPVGRYDRNYDMLQTFEPFRQGDRNYALVAPDYTATSIMDLASGEIIGGEEPSGGGFCPVGFYVPDWWDVNDGSVMPGSMNWTPDKEWPKGDIGFVWGCHWGDDSSWKVQYLDVSRAADGVISRDERFGYVELATDARRPASDFIRVSRFSGRVCVTFSVLEEFDLVTGSRMDQLE
jgi:hypothetical protein